MDITKEELVKAYVEEERSAGSIAEMLGVSKWKILQLLDDYEIPKRARGGARQVLTTAGREEFLDDNEHRRCQALLEDGEQCGSWAVEGGHYCVKHQYVETEKVGRANFPDPLSWTERRRIIDGEPFSLEEHPYLIDIYKDNSPYMVVQKAAQMGVSEFALNRSLWFCETGRGNVIYTMPTASDCSDFSKMRINPILAENDWDSEFEGREIDNVKMKQIGTRFMVLKGSYDSKHAISVPSDQNIHDEVDFSKPSVINQYKARLGHSKFGWQLFISTPTLPEMGVNKLFLETDQRHWYVKCKTCGEEHCLCCGFPDLIEDDEYRCPNCKGILDRSEGRWIAKFPEREKRGYHISRLMAPWVSAKDILDSQKSYEKTKDFYNLDLGMPYAGENMPLTLDIINACEDERIKLHVKDEECTAGVDQGNEVHVVISKRGQGNKKQIVWVEKIPIDLAYQSLEQYMDQFKIHTLVIDALPNTASARKLALKFPGRVFLCYYKDRMVDPIKWDFANHSVMVNRTESLQKMCHRFHEMEIMLPQHDKLTEFKKHLTNLVTVTEENQFTGEKFTKFTRAGDDHFAHANNYDDIAYSRGMKARVIVHRLSDIPDKKKPEPENEELPEDLLEAISRISDDDWMYFLKMHQIIGLKLYEMGFPPEVYHLMRPVWENRDSGPTMKYLYKKYLNRDYESPPRPAPMPRTNWGRMGFDLRELV